jgi:catechol 2,3-dioxygenase-like lactoylglutathione lyase family enzyme
LIEVTDQGAELERRSAPGAGPVREIAWMTAVVEDADRARALFQEIFGARLVHGLSAGPPADETTSDMVIGDVVLRLVQPLSPASRYGPTRENGRGLHSFAVRVDDLDQIPLGTIDTDAGRAWTDPAETLGLRFEWTTQSLDQLDTAYP